MFGALYKLSHLISQEPFEANSVIPGNWDLETSNKQLLSGSGLLEGGVFG